MSGAPSEANAAVAPATTPTLATAGKGRFRAQSCASSLGPQGVGTGTAPVLTLDPGAANLASFIHQNMPVTRPGSLRATQADERPAYVDDTLNHRST